MRVRPVLLGFALLAAGASAMAASAASAAPDMALVEAINVAPVNRAALRQDLLTEQTKRLAGWKAQGVLSSYRLLFSRYADTGSWDAMEILTFADTAAQSRWNEIEQAAPAGLDSRALALTTAISSTPTDLERKGASPSTPAVGHGPFLVIPYEVQVSIPEYLKYSDGYVIPQMNGWIAAGALAGYGLHVGRYYAGRSWTALLVLDYRGDEALARREQVVESVRARLAHDPVWKAIADNKHAIRAEKQATLADQLASEGAGP